MLDRVDSELEIRPCGEADEAAVLAALARAFPDPAADFVPRTASEWRWLARNPAGPVRAWGAWDGGEVVALYAASPLRVVTDGEERVFARVQSPVRDARGGPHAPATAAFVDTACRMLEATCGPDRDLLSFGWLSPEDWRVAHASLRFELLRTQTLLELPVERAEALGSAAGRAATDELDLARDDVRGLYESCRGAWVTSGVRDAGFLRWRFLEHPGAGHRLVAARDPGGGLRGYAAWGSGAPAASGSSGATGAAWLLDWLVAEGDDAAADALLGAIGAQARAAGSAILRASFPEWSPWFQGLQERGFLVLSSPYVMVSRKNHPRHETYFLRDHWWYQPADVSLW